MGKMGLAIASESALPFPLVTVHDAFRQALDSLVTLRGGTAVALAEESNISAATLSRLIHGSRKPSFDMLETLRVALRVTPADLFIPRLVDVTGRIIDTSAHDRAHSSGQELSASAQFASHQLEGGSMQHPDHELFDALSKYWDAMSPESRLELLAHGRQLKSQNPGGQSGFRRR